jgi:hypothetical protein
LTLGLGLGVFVGPKELGIAVEPKDNAVEIFLGKVHAIMRPVEVFEQLGCPGAELPGDCPTGAACR